MSQFVVNGISFENDFEAALYIVLKSDNLTVGKFYDEAVAEQKRLAKLSDWKLALLEDRSLPSPSAGSVKRLKRGQRAWVESRGRRECLYCHKLGVEELEAKYQDEPITMYCCATPDCHNPNENKFIGWDYPLTEKSPNENTTTTTTPSPNVEAIAQPAPQLLSPAKELPSGKSIISTVQKVRGAVVNNKICPECKLEGTEWVHDNAVLYICYNESCKQKGKSALDRIVGWKVKNE